jgi:hypothetical protein
MIDQNDRPIQPVPVRDRPGTARIVPLARRPPKGIEHGAMPTAALAAHSGVAPPREGFALSDVATFAAFAFMVVLARRAIRNRKRKD